MNRALDEYNNESEYVYIAYVKGMLIFDSIQEVLGYNKFINCLQTYYNDNKFGIATPDSLIDSFETCSKTDLGSLFESWINGKVKILAIK
jgi:aminopeptidase N